MIIAKKGMYLGEKSMDYSDAFIMTVQMLAGETMIIPAADSGNILDVIDWGEVVEHNVIGANPQYTYASAGIYKIKIKGYMPEFGFSNSVNKDNLISIDQTGDVGLIRVEGFIWGCTNCTSLNISENTDNFTTFRYFGRFANSLTSVVGLEGKKILSGSCISIFEGCSSLNNLSLANTEFTNCLSMASAFFGTTNLVNFNYSFINNNACSYSATFAGCGLSSFEAVNISGFKPTNLNASFQGDYIQDVSLTGSDLSMCSSLFRLARDNNSLTSLDISGCNLSIADNISEIVRGCDGLINFNTTGASAPLVSNISGLLNGASSLPYFDFTFLNGAPINNIESFLRNTISLTSTLGLSTLGLGLVNSSCNSSFSNTRIPISEFPTFNFAPSLCNSMFFGVIIDIPVDFNGLDMSNCTSIFRMFSNAQNQEPICDEWNLSSCSDFRDVLYLQGSFTTAVYDSILNQNTGWPSRTLLNGSGGDMDFGTSTYSLLDADAVAGRAILINTYNWNVIDGGGI